ncbi:CVNH domain-containing protein [Parachaetomium inaequale]|uniref:CVNH domain-containing protein n=1 Tax=Parachaetomium inaequale TaxID=2588326 RepID=A0AAN6P9A9_9PEZI|nr:CVNH domain-containing protein [Parachaetomium inaequale]
MQILVLLAAAASFLATAAAANPYANFSRSCTAVGLFHNFFLGATCCHPGDDGNDSQSENELDLTMCIGLNQVSGHMQWEVYGKFSNYCTNCTVFAPAGRAEHQLTCSCKPLVGSRGAVLSTLNLDEGIANDWGTLKCAGGMASSPRGGRDY